MRRSKQARDAETNMRNKKNMLDDAEARLDALLFKVRHVSNVDEETREELKIARAVVKRCDELVTEAKAKLDAAMSLV